MPLNALDIPAVSLHDPLLPMTRPIPYPHGRIVTAANEFRIARAEAQRVYRLSGVTVEALNGGDGRTPILDVAPGIGRQQVILIVRPRHGAEGLIVCGHYQFEGEVDSVP